MKRPFFDEEASGKCIIYSGITKRPLSETTVDTVMLPNYIIENDAEITSTPLT